MDEGITACLEFSVNGDTCEAIDLRVIEESSPDEFRDEITAEVKLSSSGLPFVRVSSIPNEIEVVVTMPCRKLSTDVVEVDGNVKLRAFVPGKLTDSGRVQPLEIYVAEELAKIAVRKGLKLPIPSLRSALAPYLSGKELERAIADAPSNVRAGWRRNHALTATTSPSGPVRRFP
jgi:hypothetical protein